MRISAKCDYACKALLALSIHWPDKSPLQLNIISKEQDIPIRYLVQILIELKRLAVVDSIRGPSGGYILLKSPEEIRLGTILREIGGPLLPIANTIKKRESVFEKIWEEVEEAMEKILDTVTFRDICDKMKESEKVLFYNI